MSYWRDEYRFKNPELNAEQWACCCGWVMRVKSYQKLEISGTMVQQTPFREIQRFCNLFSRSPNPRILFRSTFDIWSRMKRVGQHKTCHEVHNYLPCKSRKPHSAVPLSMLHILTSLTAFIATERSNCKWLHLLRWWKEFARRRLSWHPRLHRGPTLIGPESSPSLTQVHLTENM